MIKRSVLNVLLLTFPLLTTAQVELKPSIGIGDLPNDNDLVCDIPLFLDDFDLSGYYEGELIPDFNLYDLDGNELIMSELLDQGKPVLLIAGNYTCPVFRNKMPVINDLVQQYNDHLEVVIIYGLEAHPVNDISPYFGYENVGNLNEAQGIFFEQPATYGQRKALAEEMLNEMNILPPVYIDGPCNEWWANFGPAPNNAYLISTDGVVLSKHPWFDKYPNDIYCDLKNILDFPTDCVETAPEGAFTFELTSQPSEDGLVGETVDVTGILTNQSDEGVEIGIFRLEEDLPTGWESSICTDVCYPSSVTEAVIYLEAGESITYTNYFYTSDTPASGKVKIGFRNTSDNSNQYLQWMAATTVLTTAVQEELEESTKVSVYPNPASAGQNLNLDLPKGVSLISFELFQSNGAKQFESNTLPVQALNTGVYWYRCLLSDGTTQTGTILIN